MLSKINIIIRFSKKRGTKKCNLCYIPDDRGGLTHSKINIIIRLSKKCGTQKCNLYYILENRGGRLRTEAKPESTAKYRSLKNAWAKKKHKSAIYIIFCENDENITEWYSLLFTHVRLSNRQSSTPVLGIYNI